MTDSTRSMSTALRILCFSVGCVCGFVAVVFMTAGVSLMLHRAASEDDTVLAAAVVVNSERYFPYTPAAGPDAGAVVHELEYLPPGSAHARRIKIGPLSGKYADYAPGDSMLICFPAHAPHAAKPIGYPGNMALPGVIVGVGVLMLAAAVLLVAAWRSMRREAH